MDLLYVDCMVFLHTKYGKSISSLLNILHQIQLDK